MRATGFAAEPLVYPSARPMVRLPTLVERTPGSGEEMGVSEKQPGRLQPRLLLLLLLHLFLRRTFRAQILGMDHGLAERHDQHANVGDRQRDRPSGRPGENDGDDRYRHHSGDARNIAKGFHLSLVLNNACG